MILTLQTTKIWLNSWSETACEPLQNTAGLWTRHQILSRSSVYSDTSSGYVTRELLNHGRRAGKEEKREIRVVSGETNLIPHIDAYQL